MAYLGPGSSGHYVKMVHHGIEYGLMQLIAETYDLMTRELGLSDDELHAAYGAWNRTEAASYLLEITADIFLRVDERTGRRLVDVILDAAKQKGTGMWTSQNAMELAQPVPTIGAAVEMRALSALDGERAAASRMLRSAAPGISLAGDALLPQLRNALYAAMIDRRPVGPVRLGPERHDVGDVRHRLGVVEHRRPVVQPAHRRVVRRLEARQAPPPLEALQQRRLLTADVRAGAPVDDDVQVEPGAQDVPADVSARVGVGERAAEPLVPQEELAAEVDVRLVHLVRVGGDDHPLQDRSRSR